MARYVRLADGAVVGVDVVRAAYPGMSIPNGGDCEDLGFVELIETLAPEPMPWHRVVEGPLDGITQTWEQQRLSDAEIIHALDAALVWHFDSVAAERRYDSRITCAVRAGYPGPFREEGEAFGAWMDQCNALAYQIMADVLSGAREIPTQDELLAEMPAMVWPA